MSFHHLLGGPGKSATLGTPVPVNRWSLQRIDHPQNPYQPSQAGQGKSASQDVPIQCPVFLTDF